MGPVRRNTSRPKLLRPNRCEWVESIRAIAFLPRMTSVSLGPLNLDRHYRGPLIAAVFDWAGTVIDYGSRAPVLAVTQTFADFGVPITTDEARGPMGRAKRDHIQAILDLPRIADSWREVQGKAADSAAVDLLYQAFLQT